MTKHFTDSRGGSKDVRRHRKEIANFMPSAQCKQSALGNLVVREKMSKLVLSIRFKL